MTATNTLPRLSAQALSELMVASLPTSAGPHLKTPWDAVALLCHACMLAVEFRLVGLGENEKTEASSDSETPQPLLTSWNFSSTSDVAFRYKHPESSLEFLVKIGKLGNKAIVNGLGLGDEKVYSFDISTSDYLSPSSFPFSASSDDSAAQTARELTNIFISAGRLSDFAALFKINIIQRLTPSLSKAQAAESASAASERTRADPTGRRQEYEDRRSEGSRPRPGDEDPLPPLAQPRPMGDPLAARGRPRPTPDFAPPGFEDEHEVLRGPRSGGYPGYPGVPMSGERDLYPPGLGPNDPLRIGPMRGPRGGGMHPTADDPMFGGGGGLGGWDDRAPPGARYDPVGPGDPPQGSLGGPRFPQGPGGGFGGPPHNPFGGFGGNDFI